MKLKIQNPKQNWIKSLLTFFIIKMIIKNLKEFYLSCYNEACKKGITRNVLYRNRLYKGAFYLGKCYILNSKDELLNITDKKYKVIS